MTIKILKDVQMHEDLKVYKTVEKSELKLYKAGDIIKDVNVKYKTRINKHPEHVEIIEDVSKSNEE